MSNLAPVGLAVDGSAMSNVRGPSHALVAVIEYGDFQGRVRRAADPGVRMTLERPEGKERLIYRHFLIENTRPDALMTTEAAGGSGSVADLPDALSPDSPGRQPESPCTGAVRRGVGLRPSRLRCRAGH